MASSMLNHHNINNILFCTLFLDPSKCNNLLKNIDASYELIHIDNKDSQIFEACLKEMNGAYMFYYFYQYCETIFYNININNFY